MSRREINRNQLEAECRTSETDQFLRDNHSDRHCLAASSSKLENHEEFCP